MISPTPYYEKLQQAINKAKLIVENVNEIECVSDLDHLCLQAYVLLCHAAFEQYIEELVLAAAQEARRKYSRDGKITKALVALISSKLVDDLSERGRNRVLADAVASIDEFSKEAINRHRNVVSANNGIVERDQDKLLVPVGVVPAEVDIALRSALHSFGSARGDVAHKFKVQRELTRTAVESTVAEILRQLILYDQEVCLAVSSG